MSLAVDLSAPPETHEPPIQEPMVQTPVPDVISPHPTRTAPPSMDIRERTSPAHLNTELVSASSSKVETLVSTRIDASPPPRDAEASSPAPKVDRPQLPLSIAARFLALTHT